VLNRHYGANFDEQNFVHRAVYDAAERRVEMHLVSRAAQHVQVCGQRIDFAAGESLVTEHCYKYSGHEIATLAAQAGFEIQRVWTDPRELFAVQLLAPASSQTTT
jgi:YD repeat-containing protein